VLSPRDGSQLGPPDRPQDLAAAGCAVAILGQRAAKEQALAVRELAVGRREQRPRGQRIEQPQHHRPGRRRHEQGPVPRGQRVGQPDAGRVLLRALADLAQRGGPLGVAQEPLAA
jgi:hypothetical protein